MGALILKAAARAIVCVFLAYFLFSLIILFLYAHPPRHVSPENPADFGREYEKIRLKAADGTEISGWLLENPKSREGIILCHGYPMDKGNILAMSLFMADKYNLLYIDMRAMGESGGFFTTGGHREKMDISAAAGYLRKTGIKKIGIYGFSMGAAAALMAAKETGAAGVVADSPYADLRETMDSIFSNLGIFRKPLLWLMNIESRIFLGSFLSRISPLEAVKKLDIPVLLVHGEEDSQIPFTDSVRLSKANPRNIRLQPVKNADHGEAAFAGGREYQREIMEFWKHAFGER